MDWKELREKMRAPAWMTPRGHRLWKLVQVLEGHQYDCLEHAFSKETMEGIGGDYIPLNKRRPSVRTQLCRTVVEESVALLFAESHWPSLKAQDQRTQQALAKFVCVTSLPQLMLDVAIRGSVGSAAVLFEVINRVPVLTQLHTEFLTPQWDMITRELVKVTDFRVFKACEMAAFLTPEELEQGDDIEWEWQCEWMPDETVAYRPRRHDKTIQDAPWIVATRTVHNFGFVPIVWMRNICASDGRIDGACTFEPAIDTVITADYIMSQGGRGLRYSADPLLVLKDSNAGMGNSTGAAHEGGSARAVVVPPEGDAKLLEINGGSQSALLNYYRELRAIVLEQLHGNKAHADRVAASQSGRAMEMMTQSLVWLADRLRLSYGQNGLLPILRMACKIANITGGMRQADGTRSARGLSLDGEDVTDLDPRGLELHWPPWYQTDGAELLQMAEALVTSVASGILSRKSACTIFAHAAGIEPTLEWAELESWMPPADPPARAVHKQARVGQTARIDNTA